VGLFELVAWILVILVAVTIVWPLNVPLLALACKVRQGTQPLGYEPRELWLRCAFGALGLTVMTLLLLGLTYGLIVEAELKAAAGAVRLVLLLIYTVAAVAYLFWMLALEDMLQALSVFLLYVFLPGVPLFLVGWLVGAGGWISENAPWMVPTR
jgi:hypothetical protein